MSTEHDPEKVAVAPPQEATDAPAKPDTPAKPDAAKLHIPKISLDGAPLSQFTTNEDADYHHDSSHPASPFYSHEQLKQSSTARLSNYDLEAATPRASNDCRSPCAPKRTTTRDTMWPERQHLMAAHKLRKKARGCYPWRNLNKRQKLIAKVLIALFIVGIGIAIGITVSIAVGGHYYKNQQNSPTVEGNL